MKKWLLIILISILNISCTDNIVNYSDEDIEIKVVITDYKIKNQETYLYGTVDIVAHQGKITACNLNDLLLTVNGKFSKSIYVDSIASVQANPYKVDKDGKITVPVYWTFQKVNRIKNLKSADIKLVLNNTSIKTCKMNIAPSKIK